MNQCIKKLLVLFVLATLFASATPVWPKQRSSVRRVQFPRGRTTAILRGLVARNALNQYVLAAKAGQSMTVHVTSPRGMAQFDVYPSNDRQALAASAEDVKDWEGRLPQSGDYVISVYSIGGKIRYTLEVTIR